MRYALCPLLLPPRMILLVNLLEPFPGNMRIDLRGGDIGMAEHGLHRTQVGAVVKHMRCKGVAQRMRRDGSADAGLECIVFEPYPEHLTRYAPAPRTDEHMVCIPAFEQCGASAREIA